MTSVDLGIGISRAHVKVGIEFPVFGIDRTGEGAHLVSPVEVIAMELFLRHIKEANVKIAESTQGLDGSQPDILRLRDPADLLNDLLPLVHACDDRISETLIFHTCSTSIYC